MGEIVFGTDEHIAGLSRQALESDFKWVYSRMRELEDECVRLQAELEAARAERTDSNLAEEPWYGNLARWQWYGVAVDCSEVVEHG